MIRQVLGVIAGYFIFVASSLALFKFSGIEPHSEASALIMLLTAVYGALFSAVSGFVAQFIAKAKSLPVNYALAFIMTGFATFSYFKTGGSHWTQLLAIFVFAPVSVLGGWIYLRRR